MPDLGKYAVSVMSAYAAGTLMILALVGVSLWQAVRVKRRLDAIEARTRQGEGAGE